MAEDAGHEPTAAEFHLTPLVAATEIVAYPHNDRILLFSDLKWKLLDTPTPAKYYSKDNMDRRFWKAGEKGYFPPDKKMYVIPGSKKVWTIDLDRTDLSNSRIDVPKAEGTCPECECGFAYDDANRVIGGGVKGNRFYVFDPAKMAWSTQEIQGGKPGTMAFHCIACNQVNNVYVFIARGRT